MGISQNIYNLFDMFNQCSYVFYEGYLREVVGAFNDSLIIENENQYVVIPADIYPILNLSDLRLND